MYSGVTPAIGQVPDLFTYGHDTRAAKLTQFEDRSFLPKTQTPLYVPPGQAPRKLVIERKRREYTTKRAGSFRFYRFGLWNRRAVLVSPLEWILSLDKRDSKTLNTLLSDSGVDVNKIMPNPHSDTDFFLALDTFDSTEFEERTLEEWQQLMPLPCTVFTVSSLQVLCEPPTELLSIVFRKRLVGCTVRVRKKL